MSMTTSAAWVNEVCFSRSLSTGKEHDAESGNDYFDARYYASSMGRWLSPDWSAKIMPVPYAKLDNPQSLNLYAYVGNNPLTRFDPDGHTVPDSCAKDKSCQITVKVNVIWDQSAHKGNGLNKDEKANFQKTQLDKAKRDYAKSGINLEYSYSDKGGYTSDGKVSSAGLKSDSVNLIVSTGTLNGLPGESGITDSGIAITMVSTIRAHDWNWGMDGNTTELELAHQFNGDLYKTRTLTGNQASDGGIAARNTFQQLGVSQDAYRIGLEPASFSNPTNPQN